MDTHKEILVSLRQVVRAIESHSKQLSKDVGLTEPQQNLMHAIRDLGKVTLRQLSAHTNVSPATVTTILDRLERNGLVARVRCTDDKRKAYAILTEEGTKRLSPLPLPVNDDFTNTFKSLEYWEQTQLLSSVQRLAIMMNTKFIDAGTKA